MDAIVASQQCEAWLPNVLRAAGAGYAGLNPAFPRPFRWPTFLMTGNLLNVANQIVVIAVIAVGMTMVIVTGGIDLSVGSLVAISSVIAGVLIRDVAHGDCCRAGRSGGLLADGDRVLQRRSALFRRDGHAFPRPAVHRDAGNDAGGQRAGLHLLGRTVDFGDSGIVHVAGTRRGLFSLPNAVILMARGLCHGRSTDVAARG